MQSVLRSARLHLKSNYFENIRISFISGNINCEKLYSFPLVGVQNVRNNGKVYIIINIPFFLHICF